MRHDDEKQNDREREEWEADQLVALMGRYLARQRGTSPFDEPRFLDWLSRELRQRPPGPHDWSAATVRRIRRRILTRVMADRLGVIPLDGEWSERPAALTCPIGTALTVAGEEDCIALAEPSVAAGTGRELWDEACDRWIDRPQALPRGEYLALPVEGDSMVPLLHQGDVVVVRPGAAVKRDTVIVARQADDSYVVKRVGDVRADAVQLTSLNPAYPSIWISREKNAVLGTVVLRWCAHDPSSRAALSMRTR